MARIERRKANLIEVDEILKMQPRRKLPEGPFGPWMKNPPETCAKRKKDDQGYWVEVVSCAFFCKDNQNCPVFLKINADKKKRIKHSND